MQEPRSVVDSEFLLKTGSEYPKDGVITGQQRGIRYPQAIMGLGEIKLKSIGTLNVYTMMTLIWDFG